MKRILLLAIVLEMGAISFLHFPSVCIAAMGEYSGKNTGNWVLLNNCETVRLSTYVRSYQTTCGGNGSEKWYKYPYANEGPGTYAKYRVPTSDGRCGYERWSVSEITIVDTDSCEQEQAGIGAYSGFKTGDWVLLNNGEDVKLSTYVRSYETTCGGDGSEKWYKYPYANEGPGTYAKYRVPTSDGRCGYERWSVSEIIPPISEEVKKMNLGSSPPNPEPCSN